MKNNIFVSFFKLFKRGKQPEEAIEPELPPPSILLSEIRPEEFLLMKISSVLNERLSSLEFSFEMIAGNPLFKTKITLLGNHDYWIKIIVQKKKKSFRVIKRNSSGVEAYISYEDFYGHIDDLIDVIEGIVNDRFRGYENERRSERLIRSILSEHKVELHILPMNDRRDRAGVDLALRAKTRAKSRSLDDLYFQIKSSQTETKLYYKSTYIHVVIVNKSKSHLDLKNELWKIIKEYCDRSKIKYV